MIRGNIVFHGKIAKKSKATPNPEFYQENQTTTFRYHELNSVMGQSLTKNYLHIIFSTKHRQPLIDQSIEAELQSYLGGICNDLECFPVKIGNFVDHVHILSLLSKKVLLMKLVEELKSHSSLWIKTKGDRYKNFYWQNGYGAFSISPSHIEMVKEYIEKQHEHHKKETFQEEYRRILIENKIDFDERYVWD